MVLWTKKPGRTESQDVYTADLKQVLNDEPPIVKRDGLYVRTPIGEIPLSEFKIMDVPIHDADGVYQGAYTTEANRGAFHGYRYVLLILNF